MVQAGGLKLSLQSTIDEGRRVGLEIDPNKWNENIKTKFPAFIVVPWFEPSCRLLACWFGKLDIIEANYDLQKGHDARRVDELLGLKTGCLLNVLAFIVSNVGSCWRICSMSSWQ